MKPENRLKNIEEELAHSRESMEAAKVLIKADLYRESVPKIYYCLFHAIKALLFSVGLETKTHEGTSRLFSLHFIKTNIFPVEMSHFLSQMMKYKHEADYYSEYVFRKEDCEDWLRKLERFCKEIEIYLKKLNL